MRVKQEMKKDRTAERQTTLTALISSRDVPKKSSNIFQTTPSIESIKIRKINPHNNNIIV
jgi:hypothetical protein